MLSCVLCTFCCFNRNRFKKQENGARKVTSWQIGTEMFHRLSDRMPYWLVSFIKSGGIFVVTVKW